VQEFNKNHVVFQRRTFLQAVALVAVGAFPLSGFAQLRFSLSPFTLGIASGSPAPDGFVIWTRLFSPEVPAASPVSVRWEVFEDGAPHKVVASGDALAVPELAHSVHVEVSNLRPDCWYGYRFLLGDAQSSVGRTRTLPLAGSMPKKLRLAYASCQRWEDGHYAAYRHMLADSPDLVAFVGDYIYEYRSRRKDVAVRTHSYRHVRSLADYRQLYALYKSDLALQAMHAACPWLVTWDDHEVENNYAGQRSVSGSAEFELRRLAAYQAYYEHMPLRASTMTRGLAGLNRGAELRIYQHYDFGRLARLYLLDDRQYRDKPLCGAKPTPTLLAVCEPQLAQNDSRSMLGAAQEEWLAGALKEIAENKTPWNLIIQQTRFTPSNYHSGPGVRASSDNWDGYPGARQRLLDTISQLRLANTMIIGGDIHQNWVADVHQNPYDVRSPLLASEFCGTSISAGNNRPQLAAERIASANPHCLLANTEKRGYGLMDITPEQATVRLRVVNDVTRLDSGISTLATFVVENGRPGPRRVI
jgi:alkaline phosphatase D